MKTGAPPPSLHTQLQKLVDRGDLSPQTASRLQAGAGADGAGLDTKELSAKERAVLAELVDGLEGDERSALQAVVGGPSPAAGEIPASSFEAGSPLGVLVTDRTQAARTEPAASQSSVGKAAWWTAIKGLENAGVLFPEPMKEAVVINGATFTRGDTESMLIQIADALAQDNAGRAALVAQGQAPMIDPALISKIVDEQS